MSIVKKNLMVVFVLIIFSCKEKKTEGVAIYPLSPYDDFLYKTINETSIKDSNSRWLNFVVYNIDEHSLKDSIYLKKIIRPFIDSVLLHSSQSRFQICFYKKSLKLDTSFRETHNNMLYTIENHDDFILEYSIDDKQKK